MTQTQPHRMNNSGTKPDPMLVACRDLAVKMLSDSLDQFFARLEETYFELGDKSFDRKQRDDFYAARVETHNKRALLAEQFRKSFNAAFDSSLIAKPADNEQKFYFVNADPDQLSLVANEEYEESLSADKVVKSIKSHGGDELSQLEMRFARLLAPTDPQNSHNPMSPEAICDAFLQACKQLETGVDARLIAMQAFEKELSSQVANVYHQINQYLIAQNVQPLPRQQHHAKPRSVDRSSVVQPKLADAQQLSAHLSQLAHLGENEQRYTAEQAQHHSPSWLAFLDMLQHKAPPSNAVSDASGQPLTQNLLGLLRDTGWAKQLPQIDAMTLELVAMLFEHIFDDARLSPSMKSLIGRLQIPVLKVGMMDTDFFASKSHPARQLLDELALAGIDSQDLAVGMPRYEAFADIVSALLAKYEKDITVFSDALAQLQALNRQHDELAIAAAAETVDELAAHELSEIAQVTAEQLVAQRLDADPDLPKVIVQFLQQSWIEALKCAFGTQGENEPEFIRRVTAMDDLLWSVQPKANADERFKMVNLLPAMLKALEDGAISAGLSKADSQLFFSELVQCHAAAIRNGIKNAKQAPVVHTVSQPTNHSALKTVVDQNETTEAQSAVSDEVENTESHFSSPLPERGEWVEWLDDEGVVVRLRLSWVSPLQTRYLFTNKNVKGLAFLKADVEAALRSGRLTRLSLEDSITDRAIQNLLSDLN
jgi:hypothetical protein